MTFFVSMFMLVTFSYAQPAPIIGTWVLDQAASEENVKDSPQWDENIEKALPIILQRMGEVQYVYTDKTLEVKTGENTLTLDYSVVSSGADKPLILEMKVRDQTFNWDISFLTDNQIVIKSSATDDLDYFVWRRVDN